MDEPLNTTVLLSHLANMPSRTAFDKFHELRGDDVIFSLPKLNRQVASTRRGKIGVAIAHECAFCNVLIPADADAYDQESQGVKKRHWQICEGLKASGGDPLAAVQAKVDFLNDKYKNAHNGEQNVSHDESTTAGVSRTTSVQPAGGSAMSTTTVANHVVRNTTQQSRKRNCSHFIYDKNLAPDDLRLSKIAKRQKVNIRYKVYDRGKGGES